MSEVENLEKIHLFSCSFNYVFSYGLSFAKKAFTNFTIYFNIIKNVYFFFFFLKLLFYRHIPVLYNVQNLHLYDMEIAQYRNEPLQIPQIFFFNAYVIL